MPARRNAALTLGLVLLTGCAAGEESGPAQDATPPDRALVAWSETVCATVSSVDELRTTAASELSTASVRHTVDGALAELGEVEASGVPAADAHVATLTRQLEQVQPGIDEGGDVAELVAGLGTRKPTLKRIAARSRPLAPAYHLAPSCSPLKPRPPLHTPATRALTNWADTMCAALTALDDVPGPGDDLLLDPRFARFEDMELRSYLTGIADDVGGIAEPINTLPRTGITEADDYRSRIDTALRDAIARMPKADSPFDLPEQSVDALRTRAQRIDDTVSAIKPPGRALSEIAREHPALAAAHDLAPRCESGSEAPAAPATTTLPPAQDGTKLAACQDGTCQIEVSKPVDLEVRGVPFTAAVSDGTVWLTSDGSLIRLTGPARFGTGGPTVIFEVAASNNTAAVLDVSTSG